MTHWPSPAVRRVGVAVVSELDALAQPAAFQNLQIALGAIGRVGPDAAGGVPGVEQSGKAAAVMLGRIGNGPAADQAVPPVDAEMALVAEDWHRDLDGLARRAFSLGSGPATFERPARIPVLLHPLMP